VSDVRVLRTSVVNMQALGWCSSIPCLCDYSRQR